MNTGPRRIAPPHRRLRGVTLLELVVVMIVAGSIVAVLTLFLRPAVQSYLLGRHRAELLQVADASLAMMVREVRRAVPNSIRTPGNQCFEMVPSSGGGRYRAGPDTEADSAPGCTAAADCAAWVDTSQASSVFDVLARSGDTPALGDWVVINNQHGNDIYDGLDRSPIRAIASPRAGDGIQRLTIDPLAVSPGYDGGRFLLVPDATQAVFYSCVGADGTVDASGHGKGQLLRSSHYGFNSAYPGGCPATGEVLATQVRSCNFVYDPNQGATQQSGFVWLELELARAGEIAHLGMGAHVSNVP